MSRPKRGDVLVYTGEYAGEVTSPYGRGEVVRFSTNRFHGPQVTVRLIDEDDDLYADWPIKWTAPAS